MNFFRRIIDAILGRRSAPPVVPPKPPSPPDPGPTSVVVDLLREHDRERHKAGRSPLAANPILSRVAQAHADEMARRGKLDHRGSDGSWPWDRIIRAGYQNNGASENIAWNYPDAASVVDGWMRSAGHRANILGNWRDFGAGVARGADGSPYHCCVFANPAVPGMAPVVDPVSLPGPLAGPRED